MRQVHKKSVPLGARNGHLKEVVDHDGLENVELEVAAGPTNGDAHMVSHDLSTHHGQRLALGGIHLA